MNTSTLNHDSTAAMDAAHLVTAARKAHEQKRMKECLGLINQLLLCDPGSSEAQTLRASVFSDVERDLSDARVLLADSQSRSDGHKYRKAAEIILLKILYLDPTHTEAKTLLATARVSAAPPQPMPVAVEAPKPKPAMLEEQKFTAQPLRKKPEPQGSAIIRRLPMLLVGLAVFAGGGLSLYRPYSAIPVPAAEADVETPAPIAPEPALVTADARASENGSSQVAPAPADPHVLLAAAGLPAAVPLVVPGQAAAPGFLAIDSPMPAEIYMGGRYLGNTPATLQLPAGALTLEYRRGDLRTVMTHDIKTRETINALVSFDVTVQVNARPWAQVFVDGTVRKPLGQTPLSSIRVPVGTVLAFENPNFPSKSHQVTENDSSIQVAFP